MTAERKLRGQDREFFNIMMTDLSTSDGGSSIKEQRSTENTIKAVYLEFLKQMTDDPDLPTLHREKHIKFCMKGLRNLPSAFECLDSSRPWICYWILHSLYLLDAKIDEDLSDRIVKFLGTCQSETGGFGGGPGQIAHLATTYAAVNALCTLNTANAYSIIKVKPLLRWMQGLKMSNGAFRMHDDGEEDLRGTYCAITVAKLCCLEKMDPNLFENAGEWVLRCQTYEGGFGATPDNEAHGGYSFCGLAALKLLGKERMCNIDSLTYWLVNKQMKFEGGFQGRTNKLVDACYSFWQAGMFPIIHSVLMKEQNVNYLMESENWLFDRNALQEYLFICCQMENGGIIDKPGKGRDYYHTCYGLSGLSVSQYFGQKVHNICPSNDSLLNQTHPLFNIGAENAYNAIEYFTRQNLVQGLDDLEKSVKQDLEDIENE